MIETFLCYIESEKRFSKHTVISYKTDLLQFSDYLTTQFEEHSLEKANYGMIRSWVASLVEAKHAPRSVNRKIACLRTFYKYLLRQNILTKDPTTKVTILKTKKRLPSFVKEEEMKEVLDKISSENTLEMCRKKLVMELLYGTGIRLAELIQLKDTDIDLRARTLRVLGKRNKERMIPFTKNLASIINSYRKVRDFEVQKKNNLLVVTDGGDPVYRMFIQRLVKKALSNAAVEKKSPHILRHTYATHLLNRGAEINAVKDLLGHNSLAATQVYTHNTMEKLKKTFEQAHPKA